MTRLRSSAFALRATADKSSFGAATRLRSSSFGAARGDRPGVRIGITGFLTAALVAIGGSTTVLACPMCFGAQETSMLDGTKLGILVLLAITLTVQGAFVGFFLYLRRRAKENAELELDMEWSDIQRASRTS